MLSILILAILGATDPGEVATSYLENGKAGKYAEAAKLHDEAMAKALPVEKLETIWKSLDVQVGKLKSIGKPRTSKLQGYDVTRSLCKFEKAELDARVVIDSKGRVAGFFFDPPTPEKPEKVEKPSYTDDKKFTEREIEVGTMDWPLKGTLALPVGVGKPPVLILVHGSGPHDRDETIGPNAPFRDLAQGLASRGIAVIRYEKRTYAHKEKLATITESLTLDGEVIDDAIAAAEWARKQPEFTGSKVFLLGHSLGGSCAPEIAKRDPKLAGIVLMAGADRTPDVLIIDQLKYLSVADPAQAEEVKKMIKPLEDQLAAYRNGTLKPEEKIMGLPQTYMKSWMSLTPAKTAASLKDTPILVLQGGRDYQVEEVDYQAFRKQLEGRKNATFHHYPDLNHLFHTGTAKALPADYNKQGFVDVRVINDVADWIAAVK